MNKEFNLQGEILEIIEETITKWASKHNLGVERYLLAEKTLLSQVSLER